MKCFCCPASMETGATLFRVNKTGKGVKGVWACRKHIKQTDATVDPEAKEIADILDPPKRAGTAP